MEALLQMARAGPVRARDLEYAGIPRAYLRRLSERGLFEQVERGLYQLVDASVTHFHTVAQVVVRLPKATVCLRSALQIHDLTTEVPHAVWIMIDRHSRMPRLAYPKIEVVRASGVAREHGQEVRIIEGVEVSLTTPAKTVADCFRYREHVGLDVAVAALRDFLRKHRSGIDALIAAAKADRIYPVMRPYLEALV